MPAQYKENTSYWNEPSANGRIGFSKLRAIAMQKVADLQANQGQQKTSGIPTKYQSLTTIPSSSSNPWASSLPQFPTNQPVGAAFSEKYKNLQQYRTETGDPLATQTNQPWYTPETPTTRIANMPDFLGAGQYLTDPNSNNVANERVFSPAENKAILWTRDPRLYQVDHIIPLWAGGADTIANKEILTISDHAVKSKAQAVPFTLMANGLISPQEAKNSAINWEGKDITGIPPAASSGGFIDTKLAQQKYAEWSSIKPTTFKDVLRAVPEVLKNVTSWLSAKKGEDTPTQFMKSLTGWFVSEASMGILPYQQESTDAAANVGWFIGKIWGTVVAFASMGWLIGKAGQIAAKLPFLKAFVNTGRVGEELLGWIKATQTGIWVAGEATGLVGKNIAVGIAGKEAQAALESWTKNGLNNIIKRVKINSILKSVGYMNAYGQLRITAPAVFWVTKMPDMGARIQQALVDTAYGWMLWQAGHTVAGYTSVWAGTLAISLISGDNAQDAVLSAATLMALHGLGQGAANKRAKLPTLEAAVNETADRFAADQIFNKTWIRVEKLTPDVLVNVRGKLKDARLKKLADPNMDLADDARTALEDNVLLRQLEKHDMAVPERRIADTEDMNSIGDKLKTKEQLQDTSAPDEIIQTVLSNEEHFKNKTPLEKTSGGDISWAPRPTGLFPVTGLAQQIAEGKPRENVKILFAAQEQGNLKGILVADRPELKWFMENVNASNQVERSKDIANNDFSLMTHPENSAQPYAVVEVVDPNIPKANESVVRVTGKLTTWDLIPTGWVAREKRIAAVSEWGHNNSFNQNSINRFGPDSWADMLDPKNNKDLISTSARANNIKIIEASLNPMSEYATKDSGQPFIVLDITPEHWSNSLEMNKKRIGQTLGDNTSTLTDKALISNDPQATTNIIGRIQDKNPKTGGASVMRKVAATTKDVDGAFAADVLNTFEDWINSGSAKKLQHDINKKYGEVLDLDTALQIITNKQHFTTENAFDILYDGIQSGKANIGTDIMYRNNLMPLFEKINTQQITIDGIPINSFYNKMPLLPSTNGIKQIAADISTIKEPARDLVLDEPGVNVEDKPIGASPSVELGYEKFNTFSTPQKQQEFETVKQKGADIIDNFEIHGRATDKDILDTIHAQVKSLMKGYQWSKSEIQQADDLLMNYADFKITTSKDPEQISREIQSAKNFAEDHADEATVDAKKGLNPNKYTSKPTSFSSIYPDIYNAGARSTKIGQQTAGNVMVGKLIDRAAKTNVNSFANDLQSSAMLSEAKGQTNTALLWNGVLKVFDRLGRSSDWRNKEIDPVKFNAAMAQKTNDIVTTGDPRRIGTAKTVDPIIANYEMDINVGRITDLPEPLKAKYEELQKEGYGHVYSSSSMRTNAYKGRTSDESSYNMFKYIKAFTSGQTDAEVIKKIYGDNTDAANKAIEVVKTWRLGDELSLGRLGQLEQIMYGDKKPDIAKAFEERNMYMNRGVGDEQLSTTSGMSDNMEAWSSAVPTHKSWELIEAWLSPVALDGEGEMFNNPLSHAIMSLTKYDINSLTPEEITKLSKSMSAVLWPAVKNSLKTEPSVKVNKTIKSTGKWGKPDGQWGPIDSLAQWLFQWAKSFAGKILNVGQPQKPVAQPITPSTQKSVTPQASQLGRILSMVESSGWTNKTNQFNDQGKYWYLVWFTKWTYNDVAKKASQGDARYVALLKKLKFDTPENATSAAIAYLNHRNTLYWNKGEVLGQKYTNPEDMYVNLYNATTWINQQLARKNWRNVANSINSGG